MKYKTLYLQVYKSVRNFTACGVNGGGVENINFLHIRGFLTSAFNPIQIHVSAYIGKKELSVANELIL